MQDIELIFIACIKELECLLETSNLSSQSQIQVQFLLIYLFFWLAFQNVHSVKTRLCILCTGMPVSRVHVHAHGWRLAFLTGRQGQRGSSVSPFSVPANRISAWSCDSRGDFMCWSTWQWTGPVVQIYLVQLKKAMCCFHHSLLTFTDKISNRQWKEASVVKGRKK